MQAGSGNERRGVDRIEAFSDGVFAIAITLLVLGIEVPNVSDAELPDALSALWPSVGAYFLGFAVIALFWSQHHAFFAQVERHDGSLLWINLAFLSMIALMPFSSGLIGEYGDTAAATSLFALNVGLAALLNDAYERRARRNGLVDGPSPSPRQVRRGLITPLVFGASIPLTALSPDLAQYSWLLVPILLMLTARDRV